MTDEYVADPEPGEYLNSLDAANAAVFDNNLALRIQPPAPGATRYYYQGEGGWTFRKCGQSCERAVSAEQVREACERAMRANGRSGGGGLTAMSKDKIGRYA